MWLLTSSCLLSVYLEFRDLGKPGHPIDREYRAHPEPSLGLTLMGHGRVSEAREHGKRQVSLNIRGRLARTGPPEQQWGRVSSPPPKPGVSVDVLAQHCPLPFPHHRSSTSDPLRSLALSVPPSPAECLQPHSCPPPAHEALPQASLSTKFRLCSALGGQLHPPVQPSATTPALSCH